MIYDGVNTSWSSFDWSDLDISFGENNTIKSREKAKRLLKAKKWKSKSKNKIRREIRLKTKKIKKSYRKSLRLRNQQLIHEIRWYIYNHRTHK